MKVTNNKINKGLYFVLPLISILIVIVIGVVWIQPRIANTMETQNKIEQEKLKAEKLSAKLTRLRTLAATKDDLLAQLTAIKVALPNQKEVPNLILQIQKIAEESDVELQAIQLNPGKLVLENVPPTKTGPDLGVNVSVKGNYEAVKTFLAKIYKGKRLVNMESITIGSPDASSTDGALVVAVNMFGYFQPLPPKPKDETEDLPEITQEDNSTYDLLQSYSSFSESDE